MFVKRILHQKNQKKTAHRNLAKVLPELATVLMVHRSWKMALQRFQLWNRCTNQMILMELHMRKTVFVERCN
jgi:hypothetical protein